VFCHNCGVQQPGGASYCPTCGADQRRAAAVLAERHRTAQPKYRPRSSQDSQAHWCERCGDVVEARAADPRMPWNWPGWASALVLLPLAFASLPGVFLGIALGVCLAFARRFFAAIPKRCARCRTGAATSHEPRVQLSR
jgi:hypothetical protein